MTAAAPPRGTPHVAELDGVRGLAILLVLVMHGLYIGPLLDEQILSHPYARVALLGWSGVDVFFVLSGFLITGILVRSKARPHYFRNFYARRALRIFPLYYVVVALLLYVLPRPPLPAAGHAAHLLYYQNWWFALAAQPDIDLPLKVTWSLAIEEQFYVLWPALVWFASTRALRVVCAATVIGAIALRFVLLEQGFVHTHFLTPCRMDAIAAGALLAVSPPPRAWFGAAAALLGAGGLLLTAFAGGDSLPESLAQQRWGLIAALAFGVGLLSLALTARPLGPLFRSAPLRSFGKYSYCIYLTHMLVIEWLGARVLAFDRERLDALVQQWGPLTLTIAFTVAAIVGSWLLALVSWNALERWFLRLKVRFPSDA